MLLTKQSSFVLTEENSMDGYIGLYNGTKVEVYADSIWEAKQKAVQLLNVPKKKEGLLSIMLAEVNGTQYVHNTSSI